MKELLELAKLKGYDGEDKTSDIQEWLRTKKGLHPEIFFSTYHEKWQINNFFIDVRKNKKIDRKNTKVILYVSYEEAREAILKELLNF
jgi:hypothetical protein